MFTEIVLAVTPFWHRMSVTEKEEFIDEFVDHSLELSLKTNVVKNLNVQYNGAGGTINFSYTLLTVFAGKF